MTKETSFISKLHVNASSKNMKRVNDAFFALMREEVIPSLNVRPLHGECKGQDIAIDIADVYSVMAYKDNVAALRVSKKVSDLHSGMKGTSRDGYIFITADKDYMRFLFEGDMDNDYGITPEQAEWCADWVDGVLYEARYGKPHPHPLPAFPK